MFAVLVRVCVVDDVASATFTCLFGCACASVCDGTNAGTLFYRVVTMYALPAHNWYPSLLLAKSLSRCSNIHVLADLWSPLDTKTEVKFLYDRI